MGENPAETVNEIEETRRRLDRELDELESRLPGRRVLGRVLGLVLGGGVGGAILWKVAGKAFRSRRAARPRPEPPIELQVVPERWVEALESNRAKQIAIVVAATWVGFKLVELSRGRR